jgi:heat-inducible transcriptional repressor
VVRDRVLRLDISQGELDLAARYLNENFRGWTMEDMRAELERRIESERGEYRELMKSIERLYQQGALAAQEGADAVFVEGAANLVASNPVASEKDRQRLEQLLRTLEEKEKIVKLLGAYLDTRQEAVRVVIGLDEALPAGTSSTSSLALASGSALQNFVLIGAPARVGGEVRGSLAVIGPTRLDYQHTMSAVSYIARLFDKLLNEAE